MKTKWKWMGVMVLGIGMVSGRAAANPVDGTITVTPVGNVVLTLAPTTYAFGDVDVAISTVALSSITLTNGGTVNVTVDKRIQTESAPAGWTAGTAAAGDTYVLYVSTSLTPPDPTEFTAGDHRFGAEANVTPLDGLGGSTPTIATSNSVDLWFKLDMPTSVAAQTARTITVRFTGTPQ